MKNEAIGVLDSGVGGFSVVSSLLKELPRERLVYLGDTARVPYGTRSKKVITRFALQLTKFLLSQKVKAIVVACNTISSVSLRKIKTESPVPVIGVVKPTVRIAVKKTKIKTIGVIGTRATINSGVYEREIKALEPQMNVVQQACPLFVPIVEEGLASHPVALLMAKDYLGIFKKSSVDVLILGCTHYPLLKKTIEKTIGSGVEIIDSSLPTAKALKELLGKESLLAKKSEPQHRFYLTDVSERSAEIAESFLSQPLPTKFKKISL